MAADPRKEAVEDIEHALDEVAVVLDQLVVVNAALTSDDSICHAAEHADGLGEAMCHAAGAVGLLAMGIDRAHADQHEDDDEPPHEPLAAVH